MKHINDLSYKFPWQFSFGCKPNLPLSLTILTMKVKHVKEFDEVAHIRIRLRIYAASL